mmetsp:Transcript_126083/g.223277  ORF Transcript_126083/g.223277 Transcript_126083/m.223277 type:complete len:652 (+) Transcript_126083:189-2144(+)
MRPSLKAVARASLAFNGTLDGEKAGKDGKFLRKSHPSDKAGWLEKRGPTIDMQWNWRWVVLKEDRLIMYESQEAEKAGQKKFELELNEYTKATEFRKVDAPGDAAKHVAEKPYGFVVDTEPSGGPDRKSLYYLAADNNDTMNAWIVGIYKIVKGLKSIAPPRRTSLAEFVALWQAPLLVLAAPSEGQGAAMMRAMCTTILKGQKQRDSAKENCGSPNEEGGQEGYLDQAVSWFGSWVETSSEPSKETKEAPKQFPLAQYFSVATEFEDSSGCRFWESRIRSCTAAETLNGKADLEANYQPAFRGPGEWNESARQQMAIENSFLFCHWRGKCSGILSQALVNIGDTDLPDAEKETETRLGPMNQASAQGLQVAGKAEDKVRVVVVVSIAGGDVVDTQRKHIPGLCKDVLRDLKKTYSWAENSWIVWCDFPDVEDFVKSLAGHRCLVPDHSAPVVQSDSGKMPTSYVVQKYSRHPKAPSLLGSMSVRDVITQARKKVDALIDKFFSAADAGNIKEVVAHLDKGMYVNTADDSGTSAMSIAAAGGHLEVVRELIGRRGDVNSRDKEGDTVLGCAVGEGKKDIVQLLLEHGADPKVGISGSWLDDDSGKEAGKKYSLLEVAVSKGFDGIVELLTPKMGPKDGAAPLSLADELLIK